MDLGAQPKMVWILLQGTSKNLPKNMINSASLKGYCSTSRNFKKFRHGISETVPFRNYFHSRNLLFVPERYAFRKYETAPFRKNRRK